MGTRWSEQVATVKQTCTSCPSQWEGTLHDGRCFYIRYRWGGLTIGFGASVGDAVGNREFVDYFGDEFDGELAESVAAEWLGKVLEKAD
jgi:hypothetical protein